MKFMLLALVVVLSGCSSMSKDVLNALAFGEIQELNQLNPGVDKQLRIRLYRSPIYKEGCFKETHGACQYRYFMALSTYDEYPEVNWHKLDLKGEITQVAWLPSETVDMARLKVTGKNYTSEALQNNEELVANDLNYILVVNPVSIIETQE